jgi:DNA-directed RNA polymerase specialized sigma24 family protein
VNGRRTLAPGEIQPSPPERCCLRLRPYKTESAGRQWDEEHDRYVLHCLLDLVDEEFEPVTLQAFRRLALDGVSGAEAARELGLSVAATYVAKSRILARIRQKAEGLID